MLRRAVPFVLLPLSLVACVLASSPWLRAFSSSVITVPLYGAAVLSVLLPVVVVGIGVRRLWMTIALDVVGFVFFTMLVALRELNGYADLYNGIVHGPAQILSFALPLVSPRSLLVAPIALAWLCGATVGECLARGWLSIVPYATVIATFALAYSGSARAIVNSSDARNEDTLLAAGLLLTLLLLRAAHSWVAQEESADSVGPGGFLPLRALAGAGGAAAVIALLATALVQVDVFHGDPDAPARTAQLQQNEPVDPIALIASLRTGSSTPATPLFTIGVDRRTSNFVAIAAADTYDGDTWSFADRTFVPSGGVIPDDADADVRPRDPAVTQIYTINRTRNPLIPSPWMPFQYRPQKVIGRSVDIDQVTGMIVPTKALEAGSRYTIVSATTRAPFDKLPASAVPSTAAPVSDSTLAPSVAQLIPPVVTALSDETDVSSTKPVPFLQAVAADFRTSYKRLGTGRAGSTGFADVLASILGPDRAGSQEQYATLVALIARSLGIPARLVTGFRIPLTAGSNALLPGTYSVTTADAWTWVEIPVQGLGWVALDATPGAVAATSTPTSTRAPSATPTPTQVPPSLATSTSQQAVAPSAGGVGGSKDVSSDDVLLVALAIVVVALLIGAFLLLRKRWRWRRRRRHGDPRQRLLGAWQESLDVLTESGLTDLAAMSNREVADAAGERFDPETAEQARFIGDRANAAIFSPTSWIGSDDADAAWRAHRVLRRRVRRQLSARERLNAGLRYHRVRARAAEPGPTSWSAAARAESARAAAARRQRPQHRRH